MRTKKQYLMKMNISFESSPFFGKAFSNEPILNKSTCVDLENRPPLSETDPGTGTGFETGPKQKLGIETVHFQRFSRS